jgi:hypothetical protein
MAALPERLQVVMVIACAVPIRRNEVLGLCPHVGQGVPRDAALGDEGRVHSRPGLSQDSRGSRGSRAGHVTERDHVRPDPVVPTPLPLQPDVCGHVADARR